MPRHSRTRALAAALAAGLLLAGSGAAAAVATPATDTPAVQIDRLLGVQTLPFGLEHEGTTVGGLSGIDYDPASGTWYLISDDRSENSPARFYTASLDFGDDLTFQGVTIDSVTTLRTPEGDPFAELTVDPEAIRFDPATGTLLWASEGERLFDELTGEPLFIDPFVREAGTDGAHLGDLTLPDNLHMARETGPRRNLVLEGLTLTADGTGVAAATEGPLFGDGEPPTPADGSVSRITVFDRAKGQPIAQYAYPLDAVPAAPDPPDGFADNGVTEILAVDAHRYLVLERSFAEGVGNDIRVYEIDTAKATDVLGVESLSDTDYQPVAKRLVANLADAGVEVVDNVEGMSWGPERPDGERTLVLVSDNNFNEVQTMEFIAFAVGT